MFHSFNKLIAAVFVEIDDQLFYAGIKQLYTAEFPYICCYHHGIHSFDPWADVHKFCDIRSKSCHAFVEQIDTVNRFIIITAFTKTGESFVAQWLFLKA